MTAVAIPPEHELVSVLRPGRTWTVRNRLTGGVAVVRRLRAPAAARRRAEALSGAGAAIAAPVAIVLLPEGPHALRPFIPGKTVAELLREPARASTRRPRIALAAGAALAALHERGIVHGDLHPGNVALGEDGTATLLDGLEYPDLLDVAQDAAGFVAPEVVRGARPSAASDVFALAVLAHSLVARHPFAGADALDAARRVLFIAPVRLGALRPDLDRHACEVLDRALTHSHRKRPRIDEVAAALRQIDGEPEIVKAAAAASAVGSIVASRADAPSPRPSPPRSGGEGVISATPTASSSQIVASRADAPSPRVISATPTASSSQIAASRADAPSPRVISATPTATNPLVPSPSTPPPSAATLRAGRAPAERPRSRGTAARAFRRVCASPGGRFALAAVPLAAIAAVGLGMAGEPAVAAEVTRLLDAGEVARARAAVERAAVEHPRDPWIEKLRGDVACARGDDDACVARYRAALAARPAFGADARLRANVLRLLSRGDGGAGRVAVHVDGIDDALLERTRNDRRAVRWSAVRVLEARGRAERIDYADVYARDLEGDASCATKRAAAAKLAQLRDPRVLPRLEAAERREGGLLGFLCTGDAIRRAIAATRAGPPE